MTRNVRLLIAEDDLDDAYLLVRKMRIAGFEPAYEIIASTAELKTALDKQRWDLLVSDHTMPHFGAIEALRIIKERNIDLPVLLFCGTIEPKAANDIVRAGACEFISKDDPRKLIPVIERELAEAEKRRRFNLLHQREAEAEPVDVGLLLRKMAPLLKRLSGGAVHVDLQLRRGCAWIDGDEAQIQQIVISLCVNARNAMPGGGTILIETAEIEADGRFARQHPPLCPGSFVVLSITDTGRGMSEKDRARLTDPGLPTAGGSGLGLWIVREFVRQHGGHILVDTAAGRGTSVKVLLPRTEVRL